MNSGIKASRIIELHEIDVEKLNRITEIRCIDRIRYLVSKIKNLKISKIDMGMGAWCLEGEDFPIVYDDESVSMKNIQEIVYWVQYGCDCIWWPKKFTKTEVKYFLELLELIDWLIDTTGGISIIFEGE